MEQLKQNAFWVGLVAVFAVIVAAFVIFVLGGMAERATAVSNLDKLKADLKGILRQEEEIPSTKQIQANEQRTKDLLKDLADCKAWYKQYDDSLEAWLPGVPNDPQAGVFKAIYDTKRKELDEHLQTANIFNGVRPTGDTGAGALFGGGPTTAPGMRWEQVDAPGSPSIKDIQKRYWIRARIANALLKIQQDSGGKAVSALEEIVFATEKGKNEDYPGWVSQTCELPGKYGVVLLCGIRVEISNAHVPKFLKLLLEANDPEPKLLTHIRGIRTSVTEAMQEKYEETVQYAEGENPDEVKRKKEAELNAKLNRPKPIRLFVTYEVFDFDGEKLSKPFTPPATAP